jgi:hypothetical protein
VTLILLGFTQFRTQTLHGQAISIIFVRLGHNGLELLLIALELIIFVRADLAEPVKMMMMMMYVKMYVKAAV